MDRWLHRTLICVQLLGTTRRANNSELNHLLCDHTEINHRPEEIHWPNCTDEIVAAFKPSSTTLSE